MFINIGYITWVNKNLSKNEKSCFKLKIFNTMSKTITIVGPSGVGKSTYISKIPRDGEQFYIHKENGYKTHLNIKEISFGNKKMRKYISNSHGVIVMIDPEIDVKKVRNFMDKFNKEDNVVILMNKIDIYSKEDVDKIWKYFEDFAQASISADLINGIGAEDFLPIINLL